MPDMPKIKAVKLRAALGKAITAGEAVREGIATHAQKHRVAFEDAHHKARQAQTLSSPLKKSG